EIEGQPVAKGEEPEADIEVVSPGYFKTLGIPVISGREFTAHDNVNAPGVVVINQAFARRYFPNQNPIGKRMEPGFGTTENPKRTREIVGVVGDVRLHGMNADAAPEYYVPYAQGLISSLTLCVKGQSDPLSLTSAVRREVQAMDKEVPIFNVRPLEEYIAGSMAQSRFAAFLLGSFASLALVLTAIGLYGVMAYTVAQRVKEIGLRMALGATRGDVLQMVLQSGLRLTALGIALGCAGAVAASQLLSRFPSLLFGVKPLDAVTFASVIGVLAAVSLLAGYIPARRATRVDPMIALRNE
ncbi:MAG TPA: FtsX-like permease family protein, partial [Alphaproteobacteria bacterium]|nr:FtsX-like permease family protein [Alphaproteobacteria bacterium]